MTGSGGILVLDFGTTSLKAALVGPEGLPRATAERDYGAAPAPHRQSPEAWWRAACAAVAALGEITPSAIAFSGTMENLIPVTAEGRPVGPAMLYSDPCGEEACRTHAEALAAIGAAAILGNPPEPLMTAFKILWLAEAEPAVMAAARWLLLSPKDAVILHMTGRAVTDPTTATTSGMMDLPRRAWSQPILDLLGIDGKRLPEILPADAQAGTLDPGPAAALGLRAGIPVINGCGDAGASTIGARSTAVGDVSVYLGTSGWVARVVSDAGIPEPRNCYRLAHPIAGQVIEIAPILSAGGSAAWARRIFGMDLGAADAAALAADADPPDLVFLPYLSGERSPELNLDMRGGFLGLDAKHGPGDLYYAALEGVGFAVADCLRGLVSGSHDPRSVSLGGGGARSAIWPQLIADMLGRPVEVLLGPEFTTAAGAACLAGLQTSAVSRSGPTFAPRRDRQYRRDRLARAFDEATRFARRFGPGLCMGASATVDG